MLLSPGTGGIVLQIFLILSASSSSSTLAEEYKSSESNNPDEENSSASAEYGPEYYSGESSGSGKNKEGATSGFDPANYPPNPADLEYYYTPIEFDGESGEASGTQQKPKKVDPFAPLKRAFFAKDGAEPQYKYSSSKPGPKYASYEYPKTFFGGNPNGAKDDDKSAESGERDANSSNKKDVESVPPVVKSSRSEPKIEGVDHTSAYKRYKDSYDRFEAIRDAEKQLAEQSRKNAYYNGKNADYNTGKSSSTVSQTPQPETAQTTYQDDALPKPDLDYNIEPVDINYDALQSTYLENLEKLISKQDNKKPKPVKKERHESGGVPQPTQKVAEILEGCKKVTSPENMNCVVCEDAGTKSKYTQCTYSASEDPINQYTAGSVRYSVPASVPGNFRYKRSIYEEEHDRDNPYFEIAQRSKKYFEDYEKEQENSASNRDKDYYYNPYQPSDYESYSESQSSDLLKTPGACTKVEREGAECTVCRDEKTGGNFEQCSYVSKPKESKYAYVAEKKFDSDDEPEKSDKESGEEESRKKEAIVSPATPVGATAQATNSVANAATAAAAAVAAAAGPIPELIGAASNVASEGTEDQSDALYQLPYYNYHPDDADSGSAANRYDIPEHFASSVQNKKVAKGGRGGDGSGSTEDDDDSFNRYRYSLFPDLYKSAESNDNEAKVVPERKKQDVEEVLAEFAKKDRSKCKKAEKNGMTCFLCVDQNKIQNEECMYVAESKPTATHVAYHGMERLKDPSPSVDLELPPIDLNAKASAINEAFNVANNNKTHLVAEKSKRKKYFKKNVVAPVRGPSNLAGRSAAASVGAASVRIPVTVDLSGAASQVYNERVPYESNASNRREKKRKYNPEAAASAPDTETIHDDHSSENSSQQQQEQQSDSKSQEPEPPKEIDVGDEEGAYTHETKPVYSKLFDTTLPRYMIEKTEFEKDFDAEAGFD